MILKELKILDDTSRDIQIEKEHSVAGNWHLQNFGLPLTSAIDLGLATFIATVSFQIHAGAGTFGRILTLETGLVGGLAVSVFSKPLALLIGLLIFGAQVQTSLL